jgi:hypothetical protein
VVRIDQLSGRKAIYYLPVKAKKQALNIPCPTCGAKPGKKCELASGGPRHEPHRDRRALAKEK